MTTNEAVEAVRRCPLIVFSKPTPAEIKYFGRRYLYVISNGNYVKIGISDNPVYRMQSLQKASSSELALHCTACGDFQDEKKLHKLFEKCRMQGEWFNLNKTQLADLYQIFRLNDGIIYQEDVNDQPPNH